MFKIIADSIQGQISGSGSQTGASTDVKGPIGGALNAVFGLIGIIAVIMIIIGGVRYATSQGDPGKVKSGKSAIMYGIIGLIIALLAFAIVNFVMSAL